MMYPFFCLIKSRSFSGLGNTNLFFREYTKYTKNFFLFRKTKIPLIKTIKVKKTKIQNGLEGLTVGVVGGGSRSAAGDTKESAPVSPRMHG
jgi:hypothetical protein